MRRNSSIIVAVAASGLVGGIVSGLAQPERPGGGPGGFQMDPESFADRMLERDADGDGMLSRDEMPGQFGDRLFAADADGDGKLSRAELVTAAERRGGQGGRGGGANFDASFHDQMETLGRLSRGLRRSAFDAQSRESDLDVAHRLQAAILSAKGQVASVPMSPQAKEHFGGDQSRYELEFRLAMIDTLRDALALERAILQGNSAEAKESVQAILAQRNEGHDLYQADEEEEQPGRVPERGL